MEVNTDLHMSPPHVHTHVRRRVRRPPPSHVGGVSAVAPPAHARPCMHTRAHACPRMRVHPPPLRARHTRACPPPHTSSTHNGRGGVAAAGAPPQSHSTPRSPPQGVGAEGAPPAPQAPTKERQPVGAGWEGGIATGLCPPPPPQPPHQCRQGGGTPLHPMAGMSHPGGGTWATREELLVQFGFFFLIKMSKRAGGNAGRGVGVPAGGVPAPGEVEGPQGASSSA